MINIQDIIPFMEKGWVAMDEDGSWWWHCTKPIKTFEDWHSNGVIPLNLFNIAPADDWTKSLICIKGKNNE